MKKRVYSSMLVASSKKKKTGIRKVIRIITPSSSTLKTIVN